MQHITILDYVILPFVLALIYGFVYKQRDKKYPHGHPWRAYYIPGLTVKILGAIFIGMLYQYYYGRGDTFNFFYHSKIINSAFNESPIKWINLLFHIPGPYDPAYYEYTSKMFWYDASSSYAVASIGAFLGIFTLNTYLPTAVLFAYLSFTGVWALFKTFAPLYPKFKQPIAICILFIPSVFIWGSGIFKDTICLFGLGWLTYGTFRMLLYADFRPSNIILTSLSFLLIFQTKVYILIGFMPALIMWIQFNYSKKIRSGSLRVVINIILLGLIGVSSIYFMNRFSDELGKYSLENIAQTSTNTKNWISYISDDEASGYDLGNFDPTIPGMLSKFPAAVNVTLFRPYPWEAKKLIVLLSAIEAFLFFWITLKVLFTIKPKRIWASVRTDPTIQFCLIFAIAFAFAVGISTFNFGALSRYKIPCLPFYLLGLILIYYKNAKPGQRLLGKLL